ncbi:TPA: hypothetical protein ACWLYC_006660, partial [Pseudomonas aeruginosa]
AVLDIIDFLGCCFPSCSHDDLRYEWRARAGNGTLPLFGRPARRGKIQEIQPTAAASQSRRRAKKSRIGPGRAGRSGVIEARDVAHLAAGTGGRWRTAFRRE